MKLAWSPTTQATARAALNKVLPYVNGKPEDLWAALQQQKPYTRQTTWTRVALFWGWCHPSQPNPYKEWRNKHALAFKNVYQKERVDVTYDEARSRIDKIDDLSIRRRALEILGSAQRFAESCQSNKEGRIIGKGAKPRPDFRPELPGPSYDKSYTTFYRALKKVGLKPHTLRKLALTRMVDKGATAYDIMEVAGWSSIQTAASYVQPKNTDRLKKLLND
jgi:integrase